MSKLYRSLLCSGLVAAGVAACGDNVTVTPPPPPPAPTVHSISVGPTGVAIQAGSTLQMVASVNADATVATTVVWSVNVAATVASINATTGLLTTIAGQAAQLAVQACSTVVTSVCGNATISVQLAPVPPVPTVTQVTVTPGAATVTKPVAGSTTVQLSAAVIGTNTPSQLVTWSVAGTTPAGVTVSTAGLVTMTTATPAGSFNLSACSQQAGFTNVCGFATITVQTGASAQISINSVTAGAGTPGAGLPVNLNAVVGQIDINLNFNPNGVSIDSVRVQLLRGGVFKTAAKQNFGSTIPAAGIITLSVNTANFTKNAVSGVAVVDWFNGPTTMQAQVFTTAQGVNGAIDCQTAANDPTCATPLSMVFMNTDGWAADIAKCSLVNPAAAICPAAVPLAPATSGVFTNSTGGFSTDVAGAAANIGNTYWGGPGATGATTAEVYAVVYNNNPSFASGSALNRCSNTLGNGTGCITTVTWTLGTPAPGSDGTCSTTTQVALPFVKAFGTAGATACAYQNTIVTRDNVVITAAIDGVNNPYPLVGTAAGLVLIPNAVVFGATPDSLRLDYLGPTVVVPTVVGSEGFNWVNGAWSFTPAGTKVTDGGVGPVEASWSAFASAQGGSAVSFPTAGPTGASLAETNTNCLLPGAGCDGYTARASAVDRLGNGANSAVTVAFGDDQTAPLERYSFTAADAGAVACGGAACTLPSRYNGGGGIGVLDSTTNNPATAVIQALPAAGTGDTTRIDAIDNRSGLSRAIIQSRRFAQGGATGTTTSLACATTVGAFGASFIDGWRPDPQVHITCGSALPGYYTTTHQAVDRAGNLSGVSTSPPTATPGAGVNPSAPNANNANLFIRRITALDPGQPAITGVSPNNLYTGNSTQTWSLGSQNDLEVIDARFHIQYPNVTIGDVAGTVPAGTAAGLVWSYALGNAFMAVPDGMPTGPFSAGTASGTGANFGFYPPIATRWDASIINPQVTSVTQDQFTLNVQETCTGAGSPPAGASTGPATATFCSGGTNWVGDPISTAAGPVGIPLAKPTNLGVQVRDVFGSWSFNTVAGAATGVAAEFVSPILSATVAAPGSYAVTYAVMAPGCPTGGGAPGGVCVATGINFRSDPGGTAATRPFRAVQPLSVTLPIFTRVELYGLNAAGQWVFIQRCAVPAAILPNTGAQACTNGAGTVNGTDNGLERYWLYTFTAIPATGFAEFRALGVNSSGFGLFSTVQP